MLDCDVLVGNFYAQKMASSFFFVALHLTSIRVARLNVSLLSLILGNFPHVCVNSRWKFQCKVWGAVYLFHAGGMIHHAFQEVLCYGAHVFRRGHLLQQVHLWHHVTHRQLCACGRGYRCMWVWSAGFILHQKL